MSKLIDKAKGINFDDVDEAGDAAPVAPCAPERPRTAIGAISASLAMGRGVEAENRALKNRLREFEDAVVVEFLDPRRVRPSPYANRHERSFEGPAFAALKAEIASAGRNVQPIKVRRLQGAAGEAEGAAFEIAFGHRRHRACLELGLPVAAVVEDLSDAQLFAEMDRENRERANLSPWEQGVMYKRALDLGLFPSLRKLASAVGAQVGNVSTAVQLASLPASVVEAFESPLVLQYRWAALLNAALQRDAKGVARRAAELARLSPRPPAKQVLARLLGTEGPSRPDASAEAAARAADAGVAGAAAPVELLREPSGAVTLRLPGGLSDRQERDLLAFVQRLLDGRG